MRMLIRTIRNLLDFRRYGAAGRDHLDYLWYHDRLTGLYNRDFLEEKLLSWDSPQYFPLSIVFGDVNGLKLVNDAFGHQVGDAFLLKIAQVLKASCRPDDLVSRWGGDEFVIALPQTSANTARTVYRRIEKILSDEPAQPIPLSVSFGAAAKIERNESLAEVFRRAEAEMYRHKLAHTAQFRKTVISSLVDALGKKDYETEAHSWRMQRLAVQFAEHLALSNELLEELILAVPLHDIGKIAVPEQILMKPARLTNSEWEYIKEHSEIGYRITSSVTELARVAPVVLSHHEHWNGTGYPQGLAGTQIPLLSRLISIVDAYDVMTHGRPYKSAVSPGQAAAELRRCRGTQFAPEMVDAFLDMLAVMI